MIVDQNGAVSHTAEEEARWEKNRKVDSRIQSIIFAFDYYKLSAVPANITVVLETAEDIHNYMHKE